MRHATLDDVSVASCEGKQYCQASRSSDTGVGLTLVPFWLGAALMDFWTVKGPFSSDPLVNAVFTRPVMHTLALNRHPPSGVDTD
jgi:hypothetical protein